MTIEQAINRADAIKPNQYDEKLKIAWLSEIDNTVNNTIIRMAEISKNHEFTGYNEGTEPDTQLLVEDPYSEMYIPYLHSKMDLYNQDYERYNSSVAAYYTGLQNYATYYNRTNKPIEHVIKVF